MIAAPDPGEGRQDAATAGSRAAAGLALSGGGYRAMMFHLGALLRLNQAGLLGRLTRVSSVSGGSITAALLALKWSELAFTGGVAMNFDIVVDEIRLLAGRTIDVGAVIGELLLPPSASDRVADAYDDVLFHGATLQDLPSDENGPRFVFNATNIQSGALWRFSKPYMGDYRVGLVRWPQVRLSQVVAASSAFPPILSPAALAIDQDVEATEGADLSRPPFTETAILSDGGVYDNLGLEPLKGSEIVLVSDGGQKIAAEKDPHRNWIQHSLRVLNVVDNQVRSLRKEHLIERYRRGDIGGCYWGIRTDYAKYGLSDDPLGAGRFDPSSLASVPTRLEAMSPDLQDRLMNWGYAICDAALRAHIGSEIQQRLQIPWAAATDLPFVGGLR